LNKDNLNSEIQAIETELKSLLLEKLELEQDIQKNEDHTDELRANLSSLEIFTEDLTKTPVVDLSNDLEQSIKNEEELEKKIKNLQELVKHKDDEAIISKESTLDLQQLISSKEMELTEIEEKISKCKALIMNDRDTVNTVKKFQNELNQMEAHLNITSNELQCSIAKSKAQTHSMEQYQLNKDQFETFAEKVQEYLYRHYFLVGCSANLYNKFN